jgi:GH35 family endo-1,4-beta-xylanase
MSELDLLIKENRTALATVTVKREDKAPLAGAEVVIAQKKHQFLFGGSGFFLIPLANNELTGKAKEKVEEISEKFFALFNYVTLPFYWGRFEPERGHPDTEHLLKTAQWCAERGIPVKGHPLCWHTVTAPWLLELSNEEILAAQVARIKREVGDFAGLVDIWDVVNEAVIMPDFAKYDNGITRICKELGRIELIRTMFEAARSVNPNATLVLNDYLVSFPFAVLVEGVLEAGVKIDVIGLQSHMHQGYWGVEKTQWILSLYERYNLPIHFTETTIVSGRLMPPEIEDLNDYQVEYWPTTRRGEKRQALETVLHYKTLMAHPLVTGITWWSFLDGLWLKAPGGLLRTDLSVKPAYEELLRLIKGEWWLKPTRFVTDEDGKLTFRGFLGDYELTYAGKKIPFALTDKGETTVEIEL